MFHSPDSLLHICRGGFFMQLLNTNNLFQVVQSVIIIYMPRRVILMTKNIGKDIYGFDYVDVKTMSFYEIVSEMSGIALQTGLSINDEEALRHELEKDDKYVELQNELRSRHGKQDYKRISILLIKQKILNRRLEMARRERDRFENKYVETRYEININIAHDIGCDILVYLDMIKSVEAELLKLGVVRIDN